MSKLTLSLACGASDRTRPILDGRVPVEGCDIIPFPLPAEEAFHRAFHFEEFAVSELSMSSYVAQIALGDTRYRAIPVFTSRMFRHSAIYVRADSGINNPEDLRNQIVGVPEYSMTAALWVRGFLADDFGIKPEDLRWRTGGLHEPGRKPKVELIYPTDLDIVPIDGSTTLDEMLATGEIPALISARPPRSFRNANGAVRRLFSDYRVRERDYYARTGIFPMMHVIGIHTDYLEKHPWLATSLFKAFEAAKELAQAELEDGHAPSAMLPWLHAELADAQALMGEDYWPYGFAPNLTAISTMLRYAFLHGTAQRQLEPEEIFVTSSLDIAKE